MIPDHNQSGDKPTLLSINTYYYRRAGAEVVFFEHNRQLESLGWQVVPFSMHHPQNEQSAWQSYFAEEVEFGHSYSVAEKLRKAGKAVYSFEAKRNVDRLISATSPAICHAHNIYHHLSPSILPVIAGRGIPLVITLHDLKLACPAYKMFSNGSICERCRNGNLYQVAKHRCIRESLTLSLLVMFESYLHRTLGSYTRNVDRFVVPSRFFLEKFVEWGFERDKFVHIPNFIDPEAFSPDFEAGKRFVYFGRLSHEKGLETLIRAAAKAGVGITLVGTGPDEDNLRSVASEVNADVRFEGYKTGEELQRIIRLARAVVLPSEWYENAPMVVLEAYALGKPVIGADIGGIPELILPGETGSTFTSGSVEELASILAELSAVPGSIISEMGQRARAFVEESFSPEPYREKILNLYSGLLKSA